jgi:prepilin-type N-terminal cleavage/methylation domain-containing protein
MFQKSLNNYEVPTGIKGFTLIEVLIVIAIFSFGILGVAAMQVTATQSNASARRVSEATSLAENKIEELLKLPYDDDDLKAAFNPHQETQDPYEINWTVIDSDLDANGDNDAKTVLVNVNWFYKKNRTVSIQHIIVEQ